MKNVSRSQVMNLVFMLIIFILSILLIIVSLFPKECEGAEVHVTPNIGYLFNLPEYTGVIGIDAEIKFNQINLETGIFTTVSDITSQNLISIYNDGTTQETYLENQRLGYEGLYIGVNHNTKAYNNNLRFAAGLMVIEVTEELDQQYNYLYCPTDKCLNKFTANTIISEEQYESLYLGIGIENNATENIRLKIDLKGFEVDSDVVLLLNVGAKFVF
jgi:hypothetical protein